MSTNVKYVFGPVPSRRLGQSLGIDPIPLKTCNWNCVYCQLGRTRPLTNERKEFFPREEIFAQVQDALKVHKEGEIDWITFVGSGETTLYFDLGWLIDQVKSVTSLPVAVITNGSLLYQPEVRKELLSADAVLPSMDAGQAALYRKINRPHPEITFERLVEGLVAFREEYQGKLWVEVMLVRDLNDTAKELKGIASVLKRVQPDEIHILQPTRPPVEVWVQPADKEGLLRAGEILGEIARVVHPTEGSFDVSGSGSIMDAVIGIITRHPMQEEELINTLERRSPGKAKQILADLKASGQAQVVERYGIRFWSAVQSHYPDQSESQPTFTANKPENIKSGTLTDKKDIIGDQ